MADFDGSNLLVRTLRKRKPSSSPLASENRRASSAPMVDLRSRSGDRGKRLSDAAAGGRPASDAAWVIDRSKKAHTVAAGFHMPVVSGKAAAAYGDGELHPRASAPPSAAPVNRPAAAPSPDASGKTEIDAVIHSGNSVPIPLNPSPATVKGGDRKSA